MKSERLLFAIGDISDELIENAQKEKAVIYKSRWMTVAACFLILVAVSVFFFAEKEDKLPQIEITGEFGAMGFEGYMANDVSELINSNPWTENVRLKTLPVYKNLYTYDENYNIPASNKGYLQKLVNEVKKNVKDTDNVSVNGFEPDSVDVEFEPAVALPQKYNFNLYSNYEEMVAVADFFKTEYPDIINMSKAKTNIYGGDYDIYNRRLFWLSFYELKGNIKEQIINYNFNAVSFHCDDNGNLCRIRIMKTDLSEKMGDYPIASLQKATKMLSEGKYITTVPFGLKGDEKIEKYELIYMTRPTEQYYMPYYKFYIEVESSPENSMKTFGAYYVPAVEEKYISNMPIWDGSFN